MTNTYKTLTTGVHVNIGGQKKFEKKQQMKKQMTNGKKVTLTTTIATSKFPD